MSPSTIPLLLAVLAVLAAASFAADPPSSRPNIVFVYADDHATAAVGAYGSRLLRTPSIDRLAAEGLVFENAFCTNAICAPARAVVLTGKHSHANGVRDNGDVFDGEQATFPKLLRAAGYQTALVGKWHLKSDPTGFDHWEVLPDQGHYYSPDLQDPTGTHTWPGYVTDVLTDHALDWLRSERDPGRPFLLMLQHKAPHRTWMPGPDHLDSLADEQIPEPATLFDDWSGRGAAAREQELTIAGHMYPAYDLKLPSDAVGELVGPDRWAEGLLDRMDPGQRAAWDAAFAAENAAFLADPPQGDALVRWKYQRFIKDYLRCILSIDDNLGRLLDALDALGLRDDTIVVYSSDQGFFLGEHGWYDKRFMDEPSLRLPLIVRWPGVVAPGRRDTHLVQNLDLAPTFLQAAGLPLPADLHGASLLPLLRAEPAADWRASIGYQYYERGIHAVAPHFGVRTARHKLVRWPDHDEWELFDLAADPHELRSLHDAPATVGTRARLTVELARLRAREGWPEADGSVPFPDGLDALAWMTGTWRGEYGPVTAEEIWSAPAGGMLVGVHRDATPEGASFEFLRIIDADGELVYLASPGGRTPTPFFLEELEPGRVLFANREHDYPQTIEYRLEGVDVLVAAIAGPGGAGAQQWRWSLVE